LVGTPRAVAPIIGCRGRRAFCRCQSAHRLTRFHRCPTARGDPRFQARFELIEVVRFFLGQLNPLFRLEPPSFRPLVSVVVTAASVTAKITPVIKPPVTPGITRSPEVRTEKRRGKSADKHRHPIVISRRRSRIVVSRRWLLGLRIGVRWGLSGWWCLFTVSHVSLGDQATSQKDGRQKKTHFHIVFEFDFDFGLELEFDKFSLTLAQRWRLRRAVCLVSFTILGRAEAVRHSINSRPRRLRETSLPDHGSRRHSMLRSKSWKMLDKILSPPDAAIKSLCSSVRRFRDATIKEKSKHDYPHSLQALWKALDRAEDLIQN
jgi:hypothetical protein